MAGKPPHWGRIRAEYLRGGTSYRKLATKHGVAPRTLEDRAKREGWAGELRQLQGEFVASLPGVVLGELLGEAEQAARTQYADASAGIDRARAILPGVDSPGALREWAGAYRALQHVQRVALGLPPIPAKPDEPAKPGDGLRIETDDG